VLLRIIVDFSATKIQTKNVSCKFQGDNLLFPSPIIKIQNYTSKSLVSQKILHRYSIVTPSIVHRFDGGMMEERWSIDGTTTEE